MSSTGRIMMFGIGIAFLVAMLFTIEHGTPPAPVSASGAAIALAAVGVLTASWFIHAFVLAPLPSEGAGREEALTDIFAFAYVFALTVLAMLIFPFGSLLSDRSFPESGPIRLVRGCIVTPQPAAPPASQAASQSAAASQPAAQPGFPKGMPVCGADAQETHTVLVSIGGVVGAASAPPMPPASAASTHAVAGPTAIYLVRDGFVVPLLMAVLAAIGGVINLMRRVPEFQKRSHVDFVGTDKEKPLAPYEAREFVVFQVLQLLTAPFLAMVAMWAIQPNSLPAAIGLAFISGFLSEHVLLRLRALVEGPEKTPTEAASKTTADLTVMVVRAGTPAGQPPVPLANEEVYVVGADGRATPTVRTSDQGRAVFKSLVGGLAQVYVVRPAPAGAAAGTPPPPPKMQATALASGPNGPVIVEV